MGNSIDLAEEYNERFRLFATFNANYATNTNESKGTPGPYAPWS